MRSGPGPRRCAVLEVTIDSLVAGVHGAPTRPLVASRATLIVVPPALVSQWVNEVKKSIVATNPLSVKVFVTDKEREELVPLRKGSLKKSETFFASRKQSLSRLADHDIVIVTYNTMLAGGARQGLYGTPGDVNPIEQIRWTRVLCGNQNFTTRSC